jgi:hypothetical protein
MDLLRESKTGDDKMKGTLTVIFVILMVVILVVGLMAFGGSLEKNTIYTDLCTDAGYDGYDTINGDPYCYKGSGAGATFTLIALPTYTPEE